MQREANGPSVLLVRRVQRLILHYFLTSLIPNILSSRTSPRFVRVVRRWVGRLLSAALPALSALLRVYGRFATFRGRMCVFPSMETTKSLVSEIVGRLLTKKSGEASGSSITLDELADAIGAAAVTMPEIEAIFDALEAAGQRVEAEPKNPPAVLGRVLATVRSFSAISGRKPNLAEIAQHSGLSPGDVRFALLYARVLVR